MIDRDEKVRDRGWGIQEKFKRNEEVRGDLAVSLSNSKIFLWLERYKINVRAREYGL
jgi:hypothetical protein